jgi:hypothetical protein
MVHIPAVKSEAVEAETVQMAGVIEVKMTGSPELAVAINCSVEFAAWTGIAANVIVCGVLPVPMPLNRMFCAVYPGAAALSALSVNASAPPMLPVVAGVKLMDNRQD